jgi:glucokinase
LVDDRDAGSGPGDGNLVYVAPGTGLGEAVVVRNGLDPLRATVVAGEYQHTQMPRFSGEIGRVMDAVADAIGRAPDWEDLVSGRGLVRTYHALGATAAGERLAISDNDALRAGAIAESARNGSDLQAVAASHIFYQNLARFAQMLAVTFLPCGAVVFGGATSEANVEVMRHSGMVETFTEHHRFAELLMAMPLHVVGGEVNLEGAVRLAARSR